MAKCNFGYYMGIPLTGTLGKISESKLEAPFKPFNNLGERVSYVRILEMLAAKYNAGEWGDAEKATLRITRQLAAGDREHLKADFIMSIFLHHERSKQHKIKGTGRRLGLDDRQIESILRHHADKSPDRMTQVKFCEVTGITRTVYNRVVKRDYKNAADVEKVNRVAASLGL